jgi:hypothetical protein
MEKWKEDLKSFFEERKADGSPEEKDAEIESQVKKFFSGKVRPVFKKLKKELERYGREVHVAVSDNSGAIEVINQGLLELDYRVKVRGKFPYPEMLHKDASGNRIWGEGAFREGPGKYSILDIAEDVILENFLREYKKRLWSLSK